LLPHLEQVIKRRIITPFFIFIIYTLNKNNKFVKKNDMEILIKEIDTYTSKNFKGKTITEKIMYVMNNERPVEAEIFISDSDKLIIMDRFIKKYPINN
jgi:hypothetical protein